MLRAILKSVISVFAFLPIILVSCSTYKKVSMRNFVEYSVNGFERENLHYILKKGDLLYRKNNGNVRINNYYNGNNTIYNRQDLLIQDNILIPTGAEGICIKSGEEELVVDFGKGVVVPFKVSYEDNRAAGAIKIEKSEYRLESAKRGSRLYFNSADLRH